VPLRRFATKKTSISRAEKKRYSESTRLFFFRNSAATFSMPSATLRHA
jgi:hypothetical protein